MKKKSAFYYLSIKISSLLKSPPSFPLKKFGFIRRLFHDVDGPEPSRIQNEPKKRFGEMKLNSRGCPHLEVTFHSNFYSVH
jgi:hypothetical protein